MVGDLDNLIEALRTLDETEVLHPLSLALTRRRPPRSTP